MAKRKKGLVPKILIALLVLGFIGAAFGGGKETQDETTDTPAIVEQTQDEEAVSDGEIATDAPVIYEGDSKINSFLVAFNEAHPDIAVSSDAISVYHHHGRDHSNQVWVNLGEDRVLLTAEGLFGPMGVSVVYDTYKENQDVQDYAEANHRVFTLVVPILNPELSAEDVEQRWQDVLDDITNSPEWDDGMNVIPGPEEDDGSAGSFQYIKIYG